MLGELVFLAFCPGQYQPRLSRRQLVSYFYSWRRCLSWCSHVSVGCPDGQRRQTGRKWQKEKPLLG